MISCSVCDVRGGSFRQFRGVRYCHKCYVCVENKCSKCSYTYNLYLDRNAVEWEMCKTCHILEIDLCKQEMARNEENILDLFDEFKQTYRKYQDTRIPNDDEFIMLKTYLSNNVNSGVWASTLLGANKECFRGVYTMLNHDQVAELMKITKDYKFVHALAPNVLLINKARQIHSLFGYYSGVTKEDIFLIWSRKYNPFTWNIDSFVICECPICLTDVNSEGGFAICNFCQNITHFDCKISCLKKDKKCEMCRTEYSKESDIELVNKCHRIDYDEKGSLRRWTWIDYTK